MRPRNERAASNVVGVVLLVAAVLGATTVVAGFGAQALTDQTRAIAGETAAGGLERLADAAADVAHSGRDRLRVDLGRVDAPETSQVGTLDGGRMTVAVGSNSGGWRTVLTEPMDAIGVEGPTGTVAYQSGGVWRVHDGDLRAAETVRAPSIVRRSGESISLSLPVYLVRGQESVSGDADVLVTDQRTLYEPVYLPPGEGVRITVRSRFAAAWADTFRQVFPEPRRTLSLDSREVTLVYRPPVPLYLHGTVYEVRLDDP